MARLSPSAGKGVEGAWARLQERISAYLPREEQEKVRRAFLFACRYHEGQRRESGEPYILHPLAVAEILAELEQDGDVLAAALLHDVLEDTQATLEEIRETFGETVAFLVNGVTKISHFPIPASGEWKRENQQETFRKMLLATAQDPRVILIKLADRLHNLRTLQALPPDRRQAIARETLEIYAPIAHRLGIWQLKWELEDLAFKTLQPEEYRRIAQALAAKREEREAFLSRVVAQVQAALQEAGIKDAEVYARPKHIYSIYQKMRRKGVPLSRLFDTYAIRVITRMVRECWEALGVIHALYTPVQGRLKDYISQPKPNFYQSLHTTVLTPEGRYVEVQIRTRRMHEIAERGIAAHWLYKEDPDRRSSVTRWFQQILESLGDPTSPPEDFMKALREEVNRHVYVFTPKGDVVELPQGATPVDFAYAIHTEIGHRTRSALVNGVPVPLDYPLQSGDIVEIRTRAHPAPREDWLQFVRTRRARSRIRAWLRKRLRAERVERGRVQLQRALNRERKKGVEIGDADLEAALARLNFPSWEAFYEAAAEDTGLVQRFLQTLRDLRRPVPEKPVPKAGQRRKGPAVLVMGEADLEVRFARCCNPLPGDPIVGLLSRNPYVSIHHRLCPQIRNYRGPRERLVPAEWLESANGVFQSRIRVTAEDQEGIALRIHQEVEAQGARIRSLTLKGLFGGAAIYDLVLEVQGKKHLEQVLAALQGLKEVQKARRWLRS